MTAWTLEARNSYQEIPEIGIRISLEERKRECGLSDGVTTHSIGRDLGNPIAAGMLDSRPPLPQRTARGAS